MIGYTKIKIVSLLSFVVAILYGSSVFAVTPTVALPSGINLGVTSFYDGLTGDPGLSYQFHVRRSSSDSIKGSDGEEVSMFDSPSIDTNVIINQFDYKFEDLESGGRFGVGVILPFISLSTDFGNAGPSLVDNGSKFGDVTLASYFQFPITMVGGHPIFSHRFTVDVTLPTGGFDETKDINQSINAVTVMPSWAYTIFLSERWDLSGRLNYMYNFENSSPYGSAPLDFMGSPVTDIQAGQATWLNFASSYKVFPGVHVGINGYYLKQITDDKVNGETLSGSKEQVFGIGPGMFWITQDKKRGVWLNGYTESKVENRLKNKLTVSLRFLQQF